MCSPDVMATVHASIKRSGGIRRTRRSLLGHGAALAAAGLAMPLVSQAQDGTPAPIASPVATGCIPVGAVASLSHSNSPDTPVWPGNPSFQIEVYSTVEADGFYTNVLTYHEHTGTHMDSPSHFIADGITADLISPASLVAPLAVVDVTIQAATDEDYGLTVDDLLAWESEHGEIPAGALVAMRSGWDARFTDPAAFIIADADGVMHFPGFSPDAAAFLVNERTIVGIGSDTLSQDPGNSTDFGTHITILGAGLYGLEGVANLGSVPDAGAWIVVGSPNHVAASGGPSRLIALY
jgi:kynurenine formamidase